LLDSSTEHEAPKSSPDAAVDDDVIDSLTQAYLANPKQSPSVETKIASFIEQVLTGELSSDMLKETGEKYPPPDNCQHLTTVMVNGEIWDLLSRKSRTVDLGFQKVQGPFMQGLSTLSILADRLLKDVKNSKNTNIRDVLQQLMDGIVLLGNANWNLIMKRREFIKSDLNPPYTRLCKEDIKPTTKLFGDDLSKHLKEMSEAKRKCRKPKGLASKCRKLCLLQRL
jgi:hypothetical protein